MDFFSNTFNNRELATFLWLAVLIVAFSFSRQTRSSFVTVVKAFFNKVYVFFLLMFLYISLQVFLLYKVGSWDFTLLKDTVYWTLGVGAVLLVNVNQANQDSSYFKNLLFKNLKLIVILEFIVNYHTFNFFVEIFIFPLVTLFVLIAVFSEVKQEYRVVNKIANVILGIIGFIGLISGVVYIANNFTNFWVLDNLKNFLLPILLTITFIPFIYVTALYMAYELLYVRLGIFLKKDDDVLRYAKKKIFLLCKLDLSRLNRFVRQNTSRLTASNDKNGIDGIIRDFKSVKGKESPD